MSSKPDLPTVQETFEALGPIIQALPVTPQSMDDDATLCWSKDELKVGDIRRVRKVWQQAMEATA